MIMAIPFKPPELCVHGCLRKAKSRKKRGCLATPTPDLLKVDMSARVTDTEAQASSNSPGRDRRFLMSSIWTVPSQTTKTRSISHLAGVALRSGSHLSPINSSLIIQFIRTALALCVSQR